MKVSICRRLVRRDPVRTLLAVFDQTDNATRTVVDITAAWIIPAALEMMDQLTISAVAKAAPGVYPSDAAAVLLVEIEGIREHTERAVREQGMVGICIRPSAYKDDLPLNHRVYDRFWATCQDLDVAVALNWDDFLRFGAELPVGDDTLVIYDAQCTLGPEGIPLAGVRPKEVIAAPITQIAKETTGTDKAKNTVVLGLMAGWFGFAPDALLAGIRRKLGKKGGDVLERNERAFEAGRQYAASHPSTTARTLVRAPSPNPPARCRRAWSSSTPGPAPRG